MITRRSAILSCASCVGAIWINLRRSSARNRSQNTAGFSGVPDDAGILDVKTFGAAGDGSADDTAAIMRAIGALQGFTKAHPYSIRSIYFPAGVYCVSETILRKDIRGRFQPNFALIGEAMETTIIRLCDYATGFGDPSLPKSVIYAASGLEFIQNPRDGGRNYFGRGEGNEAFGNFIENLTIDVGQGNPGAIGIDFVANNCGAIRNVSVRSTTRGVTGISMVRRWPGPLLISNVVISGFGIGIDIANTEYSVTLDDVKIFGSTDYGLRNSSNIVSFCDLAVTTNGGCAVANVSRDGLIVGTGLSIAGWGQMPLNNFGAVNLHSVELGEFRASDSDASHGLYEGVFQQDSKIADANWRLSPSRPPQPEPVEIAKWVSVAEYGAIPDPKFDSTAAFVAALGSEARVIYVPVGQYKVTQRIPVGNHVERVEGMFSTLVAATSQDHNGAHQPLFVTDPEREKPLFIRKLIVERQGKFSFIVEHPGAGTLVLSDIVGLWGMGLLDRPANGGQVFAENIAAGHVRLAGRAGAWFRQLNTEGPGLRVLNDGAPLWVLGVKSEDTNTLVHTGPNGITEILGGFVYRVFGALPQRPLFVNRDGRVAASYAEECLRQDAFYAIHLDSQLGKKRTLTKAETLPKRGSCARLVAFLSTDDP